MKRFATSGHTFAPSAGTIDLGASGATPAGLLAILNQTIGAPVYLAGSPGFGAAAVAGSVVTLQAPLAGMAPSDRLQIVFDDGAAGALDSTLQALITLIAAGAIVLPRPAGLTFTETAQDLGTGATMTVPADATIKYLDIAVVGTGAVRFTVDASKTASATVGKVLAGSQTGSPGQGGGFTYESTAVPTRGVSLFALAATTVVVTIGR